MGINKMEYNKYHFHELIKCYEFSKDGVSSVFAEVRRAIEKVVLRINRFMISEDSRD